MQDYNHLVDNDVRDQNDGLIPGLELYAVTVSVTGATLNTVPMMLIDISVDHPAIDPIRLIAYRANY